MAAQAITYTLNLNWETEHDTANGLMTHTFTGSVKVVTSIKTGRVKVYKHDILVNAFDASGWKLNDYTQFLAGLATDIAVKQLTSAN
jgi:hypothetical protein